jgi:hypothetical protein
VKRTVMLVLLMVAVAIGEARCGPRPGWGLASSVGVARPLPVGPPPGTVYTTNGQIRPADNPHWCLTRIVHPTQNTQLFVLPCGPKTFAPQHWFAWDDRHLGTGGINIAGSPDWAVAKWGNNSKVLLTTSTDVKKYTWLIGFTPYAKGWLVDVKRGRGLWFMTVPSHLVRGKRYGAVWKAGSSSTRKSQEWLFPPWKHLDS